MKKQNLLFALFCLTILSAELFSQAWTPGNATSSQNIFRAGKVGIGTYFVPDAVISPAAWYSPASAPQLDVWAQNTLNTSVGSSILLGSFSGPTGVPGSSQWIRNSRWLLRSGTASPWTWSGVSVHDGISVDGSFLTPATDTKTWWERDPSADLQTWGNDNNKYMRLAHGKLALGTGYNPDESANAWYGSTPGPIFELSSVGSLGLSAGNNMLLNSFSANGNPGWIRRSNWLLRKAILPQTYPFSNLFMHDGLSIDGSYSTPGTNTKTWWERDAISDYQGWGQDNLTYMSLFQGRLRVGNPLQTTSPHYYSGLFTVKGKIVCQELIVTTSLWADFVFDKNYKLMPLNDLENFYKENKHLPEIPNVNEVSEMGIDVGAMNTLLLKKVEELTIYLVDQNKRLENLEHENKRLTIKK